MIVLIGGEKGGTGKTTIATNIACIRAAKEHDVLLVDTDKQGSASAWSSIRNVSNIKPSITTIQKFGSTLSTDIIDLKNRYEDIIIDAGGRDSVELRSSMVVADKMYIPVQASQFDVWTLALINELVGQVKAFNPNLLCYVLVNRATTNVLVNEVQEALEVLEDFGNLNLSNSILKDRICYRKAAKAGLSINELDKNDIKGINEITKLYEEIFYAK